jgi:hypothetical protein
VQPDAVVPALLGTEPGGPQLDRNGDGVVDAADLVR